MGSLLGWWWWDTRAIASARLAAATLRADVATAITRGRPVEEVCATVVSGLCASRLAAGAGVWREDAGRLVCVATSGDATDPTSLRAERDVVALVTADGAWGQLRANGVRREARPLLGQLAGLIADAHASAETRASLEHAAYTDSLTGLANPRAFHHQLRREIAQAARSGEHLALVFADIDHFKQVNDRNGHAVGDAVLEQVAVLLQRVAREGDLVARVGGEEFAWILPQTGVRGAWGAAERLRRAIADAPMEGIALTTSAGIVEWEPGWDASDLVHYADAALYWAKRSGRDRCVRYRPGLELVLDAEAPDSPADRERVIDALRRLASTLDERGDGRTAHSERVGAYAAALAAAAGWSDPDIAALREAARVHDVGMLLIPEDLLEKPGPLSDAEREQFARVPELSAAAVQAVLAEEPRAWIRHHLDPSQALAALEPRVATGAAFLGLANAWDAMTSPRPWRPRVLCEGDAARVVEEDAGSRFLPEAVAAWRAARAAGRWPELRPAEVLTTPHEDVLW